MSISDIKAASRPIEAVIGGFDGIGRAVIEWLVKDGAKQILSVSRSGVTSHETREFVIRGIEQ
ncbi:hypothetical protein ACRE_083450 [Hapsidospora chrysogenum ATCC 11550]|uniref:Ketoreductase (KR) domain-containing protein n=1 Tax=Hapsidospora chrysogenum (strain ATCC 11550 / CBS 779.69 / DSM 880 / IAM 14645 / JCM 23072 / IMI 49137) TaxID=857340 RepID=A0A086SV09_HAPC1|nr:hypothetical protein ACRE_083450 [Hapsidospora chrysogenum ATCC 11550]